MKLLPLLFSLTGICLGMAQEKGSIVGKITDKELNNEPLAFANLYIKGTTQGATTDIDGLYEISQVEAGNYTLVISFIGYETLEIPNTMVTPGKVTEINAALGAGNVSLQEVVIATTARKDSEVALLVEQKKAMEMKTSIGAEELAKKAVTNVEQGLTKISGITKVQNRGIFVRGLDDRYNNLLVNGLPVVSSDPDTKIIPLEYLPAQIVSHVDVLKTFNASLYQDFAGATFEVTTKTPPANPVTTLTIGANFNTLTSLRDFYTDDAGATEFWGYTGGGRAIPSVYNQDHEFSYSATPQESLNLFNASWTPHKIRAPLDTRLGFSHGQQLYSSETTRLGFTVGLTYNNSFNQQNGVERVINSEGTAVKDFQASTYNFSTQKSALLALQYKKRQQFEAIFNAIYLQNSSNFITELQGLNNDLITLDRDFFLRDTRYAENSLLNFQLLTKYEWNQQKNQLHLGASLSTGRNNVPNRRVLPTEDSGENAQYITVNGINPFTFYQELNNVNANARLDYEVGLGKVQEGAFNSRLKAGYNFDGLRYDFYNRTIFVNYNASVNPNIPDINTNNPQEFFNQGFSNGYLFYRDVVDATKKSRILQYINAGYVDYSWQWKNLLLEIGLRAEYAFREITYRNRNDNLFSPYSKVAYTPFDLNPSLNLKYQLGEKDNLRFTASRTSTRPRTREILPTFYQDGTGNQVIGNENLQNATNYNTDIKYELFPSQSQLFTVSAFGKYIHRPIERLYRATTTGFNVNFDNFDRAYLFGLEVESKVNIGDLFKKVLLDKFTIGCNGILMKSQATTQDAEGKFGQLTNKTRRLQGASDWGVNADLAYEIASSEKLNSTLTLIFNTYGKRIYAVGVEGADDVFEKPINQLDFSWNTSFGKKWGVRLTLRNILNEKTLFTQNPTHPIAFPQQFSNVIESYSLGTDVGITLTRTF